MLLRNRVSESYHATLVRSVSFCCKNEYQDLGPFYVSYHLIMHLYDPCALKVRLEHCVLLVSFLRLSLPVCQVLKFCFGFQVLKYAERLQNESILFIHFSARYKREVVG